jgi:dienelactone hydrolase
MNIAAERTQTGKEVALTIKPRRGLWGWLWRGLGAFLLVLLLSVILFKVWWDSQLFSGYDPQLPLQVEILDKAEVNGHYREKLRFQGVAGDNVIALYHYPREATGEFPCVMVLYGIGQKMSFVDEIAEPYVQAGLGIICIEQYGRGERKIPAEERSLKELKSFFTRISRMVVDTRRTVDFLLTRPEIDHERLVFFGISLGAMVGTSALAMEPRFCSGVLFAGGGDLPRMFSGRENQGVAQFFGSSSRRMLTSLLLSHIEPLNWIHQIAPRPLLFQNALHDEIIPKACTVAYYEKAGQPKEILWYDCGHEQGLTLEIILQMLRDQIIWIKKGFG